MTDTLSKVLNGISKRFRDMGDGTHAEVVALGGPDTLAQTLGYDASGNLKTITATDGTNTWVQTYTYAGGLLTGISAWVKQ